MRTAIANQKLNDYDRTGRSYFEQEILTQVAQFEVLLSQIEITKVGWETVRKAWFHRTATWLVDWYYQPQPLRWKIRMKTKRAWPLLIARFLTVYYEFEEINPIRFFSDWLLCIILTLNKVLSLPDFMLNKCSPLAGRDVSVLIRKSAPPLKTETPMYHILTLLFLMITVGAITSLTPFVFPFSGSARINFCKAPGCQ